MRIDAADEATIELHLRRSLVAPVAIEVWTREESALGRNDRDPCTHCDDVIEIAKQMATLHPLITITLYDIDKHADRAAESEIIQAPLTVFRAKGKELRFSGLWAGPMLPVIIDAITFASTGSSPITTESRDTLNDLPGPVTVELLVAPHDPYSIYMARLVMAMGVESRNVHVRVTDAAQFPLMAAARSISEVPVLLLNEKRFLGTWEEVDLVVQLTLVAIGDDTLVIRDRTAVAPFVTEVQALAAAEAQITRAQPPSVAPGALGGGSGFVLPRR